jgi:5'-nucleotidase
MEGLMLGVPAIAISFAGGDVLRADTGIFERLVPRLGDLLRHLTSLPNFPKDTVLNVNLPPVEPEQIRGVRLTRLGRRVYSESLSPMRDPWGRQIYWIGAGRASWTGEEDSDFRAVRDGYISVTPLHLDLTHHSVLSAAESWWRDL